MTTSYTDGFYRKNIASSTPSAEAILRILFDIYQPASVVDFGCGSGAWLTVAEKLGCKTLRGYDGPWVDPRELTSQNIDFSPVDFENGLPRLTQRYDLAISVEVAEHLDARLSSDFVKLIGSAADVVVFGAAIPMQGGTCHVNEQPQSYWRELFDGAGFDSYDIFRGAIWNNESVRWWFRQNTVLMVRRDSNSIDRQRLKAMEIPLYDVVHPANYMHKRRRASNRIAELKEEISRLRGLQAVAAQGQAQDAVISRPCHD